MSDSLKLKKGLSSNLNNEPKESGKILFATDTGAMYIDNGTTRIQVKDTTKLASNGTAVKATSDANGNNIANTYIKNIANNTTKNKTITITKGNNTTSDVTITVTKSDVGLGNVDNKSSATIRGEITKDNITKALGYTPVDTANKGSANGLAELDANGKVPSSQLPSYVDDVLEYSSKSEFPTAGETGKIYVDTTTNLTYRWSGSAYIEISPSLALGQTSSTAFRGDYGKKAYDHSQLTHARTDATNTAKSNTNGNIKINGTETSVYTLPTASSTLGGVKTTSTVTSNTGYTATPIINGVPYYKDTNTWTQLKGATTTANGTAGYVPAPEKGEANRYLRSDGSWSVPPNTDTKYSLPIASANELGGIKVGTNFLISSDGTLSSNWGNTYITNADEAPLGFSRISNDGTNNPFTFWCTLLTAGSDDTNGYRQQWAFPWGDAEATMQAPKYRVKDNGNWGNWISLKDGGNANTVGGIAVTKLKGNDTKFIYTSQNGIGEHNLTEFKEEGHYFVFNYNDSPTNYGFLDISVFDGNGFTPMPNGIIRQLWTDYRDPSKYYMRIYNSTSATEGSWTNWTKISDNGSAKAPSSPQTSIDWDNISFEERSKYIDVKNLAFWNGAYSDNGNSNITRVQNGSPLIGITASGTNLRFTTADGSISSKTVTNIGIISGSALGSSGGTTATTDAGKTYGIPAVTTSPYTYAKWISNLDCGLKNLYNGMIIKIIVPVTGNTRGTCLSIDGGTTYHPVVYNTNSLISTHFGIGTALLLMYDNNISASVYNNSTTATAIKGVWRVLNNFDTDNDTKVTNTLNTTTKAYITGTTSPTTNTGTQIFDTGIYLDTTAGMLTANTFNGSYQYKGTQTAWSHNTIHSSFEKGNLPTSTTSPYYWDLNFTDKNGAGHANRIGYIETGIYSDGRSKISLNICENKKSNTNFHSISITTKEQEDGTFKETVQLGSKTLGAANKPIYLYNGVITEGSACLPLSGGTISGNVTFNNEISNIVLGQHTAAGSGDVPYGYINLYNRGSIAGNIYGSNDGGLIVRSMTNNTGSIGDGSHYFGSAYINNLDKVTMIKESGDTYHIAERTDLTFTDSKGNKQHEDIRFGISNGDNRGIWDRRLEKWLVRADTSGNVYFGDPSYADKTSIRGKAIQKIGNINRTSYSGPSTKWIMVSINSRTSALLVFHFSNGTEHYLLNYTITNTNGTIDETQILSIKSVAIFIKLTNGKIGWYIPNLTTGATCTLDVYAYD